MIIDSHFRNVSHIQNLEIRKIYTFTEAGRKYRPLDIVNNFEEGVSIDINVWRTVQFKIVITEVSKINVSFQSIY